MTLNKGPGGTIAIAILSLFGVVASAHRAVAIPVAVGPLIWSDEFDTSALDTTKWGYRNLGVRNDATNTPQAVSVAGGNLKIATYTDTGTHYTAMLSTQNLFQPTYGYYESRVQYNNSSGQWGAFWLQSPTMGTLIGDPANAGAEIDISEHRAFNTTNVDIQNRTTLAVHWDGYAASAQSVGILSSPIAGLSNGSWHTYGLLWTSAGYSFYLDDALLYSTTSGLSQRSEYLILSSEVHDNNWAGTIPTTGYGTQSASTTNMLVDYVRVYSVPEPSNAMPVVAAALTWRATRRRRRVSN